MDQRVSEERRDSHGPSGSLFRGFRSQTGSPHLISPMSSTLSSVEQPLGSKAGHGSISSATLSDQPADRETSGSPIPISPTSLALNSTSLTSLAFDSTDIGEFSDGGYEGQNDDYSEYSMEIPHDLGDAGTYRHHGGNSGDAKRRGNSVSTNQKRRRDGPSSQDDEDDDNPPKKPSKRQKVEGIKGKTTGNCKKPFACPYFKRSQYLCPRWKGRNVQEVINHCISQHLQLWCPRCKEFQTDIQTTMNHHLENDNCLNMAPGDDYLRNGVNTNIRDELLRYRYPKTCTWSGVYRILFHRNKPTIPDGFWYDAEAIAAETFGNPSLRLSQCVPIPLDKQSGYQSGLAKTLAHHLELDEDYLKKTMIEFNTEWAASNSDQVQSPGIGGSETNPRDINNDAIASGVPSGIPQTTTPEQTHDPIVSGFPSGIPSGTPQPTAPEQTHNPIVSDIDPLQYITTTLNQQYNPNHPAVSVDGPAAGPFDDLRAGTGEMRPATTPDENHLQPVARTTLEQGNDLINAQDPGPSVCNIQPWALDISPFLFSGSPNFDYLPE